MDAVTRDQLERLRAAYDGFRPHAELGLSGADVEHLLQRLHVPYPARTAHQLLTTTQTVDSAFGFPAFVGVVASPPCAFLPSRPEDLDGCVGGDSGAQHAGKVCTREEAEALFDALDVDRRGYLHADALRDVLRDELRTVIERDRLDHWYAVEPPAAGAAGDARDGLAGLLHALRETGSDPSPRGTLSRATFVRLLTREDAGRPGEQH